MHAPLGWATAGSWTSAGVEASAPVRVRLRTGASVSCRPRRTRDAGAAVRVCPKTSRDWGTPPARAAQTALPRKHAAVVSGVRTAGAAVAPLAADRGDPVHDRSTRLPGAPAVWGGPPPDGVDPHRPAVAVQGGLDRPGCGRPGAATALHVAAALPGDSRPGDRHRGRSDRRNEAAREGPRHRSGDRCLRPGAG